MHLQVDSGSPEIRIRAEKGFAVGAALSLNCSSTRLSAHACEESWLPAARAGCPDALELFYRAYRRQVHGTCFRLLGNEEDALDATQAAFVRAFKELPRFRGESSARTWLYRIAVNEALTVIRRRRPTADIETEQEPACQGGCPVEQLAVRAALERMRPRMRVLLVLRFWEELDYREIARVTGMSLPGVKMGLHRARAEFKKCYERR